MPRNTTRQVRARLIARSRHPNASRRWSSSGPKGRSRITLTRLKLDRRLGPVSAGLASARRTDGLRAASSGVSASAGSPKAAVDRAFYFDEDQLEAVLGDDVEFAAGTAPVPARAIHGPSCPEDAARPGPHRTAHRAFNWQAPRVSDAALLKRCLDGGPSTAIWLRRPGANCRRDG